VVDVVFALAYVGLLIATLVVSRSAATTAILAAFGVGVSGVALQFVGTNDLTVRYDLLQWWLLATFVLILAAAVVLRRREPVRMTRTAWLLVVGSAGVVAVAFLASRLLAPGSPGPLTSVGYLISRGSAEDNAKWLNAGAELAGNIPINAWANVGGPLLLLLTFSATLISTASVMLYGGVNEVAVSAGTLVLSEMLLIVLAPFALAPLVEARLRRTPGGRRFPIPWPLLLLSIVILVSGMTLLLNYGHLTLQYTLLILTLWMSTFLVWRRRGAALIATTLAVATTAEVWFPLSPVAALLLVGGAAAGVVALLRRVQRRRDVAIATGAFAVVLVLMWEFLTSSISYSLGVGGGSTAAMMTTVGGAVRGIVAAVVVPTLPLFSQNGGSEVVSTLFAALTVAAVVGALLVLRDVGGRRYVLRFAPLAVLVGYTILVTFADYFAVGKGPGYATNKLTWAIAVPTLAATLPIGLLALDRGRRGMTSLRWFALAGVVMLLVVDTFLPRAIIQLKPSLWPTTSGSPQPYWWPAEVRPTADQPLSSNPVGCVYLPQGADKPSVLQDGQRAYSCTRLLTGLAGQEGPGQGLVQWTLDEWLSNESQWDHYQQYFNQMIGDARERKLILLDNDSKVIGIESLQSLMDRYPAAPVAGAGSGTGSS
jgi:hypothetical protein